MTDRKQTIPRIGIAAVAIACIFLFNPTVAVSDPLPDAVGYLLLYCGLSRVSACDPYFERSRTHFSHMLIASAILIPLTLFVSLFAAESEQDSLYLILTFLYCLCELLCALPAWRSFFAATRQNGVGIGRKSLFAKRGKRKKRASANDSLARFTTFFLFAKTILVLLPELSLLSVTELDDGMFRFRRLFRFFSVTLLSIFGLIWLIRCLHFLLRLRRDRGFCTALDQKYEERVRSNPSYFIKRTVHLAFILIGVGLFLLTDFTVNHVNVIPDPIGAILILCGCLLLHGHTKRYKGAVLSAGLYAVYTGIFWVYEFRFIDRFGEPRAAARLASAYYAYEPIPFLSCAEAFFLLLMLAFLARMLVDLIQHHAGYTMLIETAHDPEAEVRKVRRRLCIGVLIVSATAILPACADILLRFTQPYMRNTVFEYLPLLRFLLQTAFATGFCAVLAGIRHEIEYQYRTL